MDFALALYLVPVAIVLVALVQIVSTRERVRGTDFLVRAKVIEVVRVPLTEEVTRFFVRYRYADGSGVSHEAKSQVLTDDPTPLLRGGKTWIQYDPAHPERSTWVGRPRPDHP